MKTLGKHHSNAANVEMIFSQNDKLKTAFQNTFWGLILKTYRIFENTFSGEAVVNVSILLQQRSSKKPHANTLWGKTISMQPIRKDFSQNNKFKFNFKMHSGD